MNYKIKVKGESVKGPDPERTCLSIAITKSERKKLKDHCKKKKYFLQSFVVAAIMMAIEEDV